MNATLIVAICLPKRGGSDNALLWVMWMLYTYLTIYLPQFVFVIFDALSRLPYIWSKHRWTWMSWTGFGVACALFIAMWWGALFNRFRIQTVEQEVAVNDLPPSFNGLKIAQISDLHVGTFGSDTSFCAKLVDKVNALNPDVIVFTGDIVNRHSSELKPFTNTLARLKAPMGVYSIMGNHDYGDYHSWKSAAEKDADIRMLQSMQRSMGWKILNNATEWLKAGSDSIALIGVENVGDPPFHTYGDLSAAFPRLADSNTKILLTHNPAHWTADIANTPGANIALTLSGHTHAMQCEIMGLSPAAFRYKTWGGMYTDSLDRKLYVNIGAGEVGFPARIGATPEITLFTLKTK